MSRVTNVVVHVADAPDEVHDLLDSPFPFEEVHPGVGLMCMGSLYEDVGGTKAFEDDLYVGAFNYLDEDAMREWFLSLPWGHEGHAGLSYSTEGSPLRVILIRSGSNAGDVVL